MTYPVDDLGNPRVDFVWGQFPLQPNDQRTRTDVDGANITTDTNWTVTKERGSSNLNSGWTNLSFGTGDGGNTREQTFTFDSHEIATTGYSNYPEFLPNYAGDGDTGLEEVVPNIVGLAYGAVGAVLTSAGFVDSGAASTFVGATVANNGHIKTQNPAAGALANIGMAIGMVKYNAPTVPNLVGLTEAAATTALTNAHLTKGAVTTADNAAGATALNDGEIKTQSIASGTTVDTGTAVALVKYAYVATSGTVPNIEGMTESAAIAALAAAGFTQYNNDGSATNVDGATALNDGKVKQGTTGVQLFASTIHYWTYNYTAPATTGPIAGFNRLSGTSFSLNGSDAIMYLTGRTVKPTLGDTITVSGTTASAWNQTWLVDGVEDNDSYNSGGTAVKITAIDDVYFGGESGASSTGGTWTKI